MDTNINFDIVDNLVEKSGIKKKDFYGYTGISRQGYSNFKSQGYIPARHGKKIASFFGISVDDLYKDNLDFNIVSTKQLDEENYVTLPTIHAGAGAEAFAVDRAEQRVFPRDLIPPQIALDENVLVTVITGNSMEPLYYENDIIFIDMVNGRAFIPVDGTYLVRYGDIVQIKDVEFIGNGEILLRSRNNTDVRNPSKDGLEWEIIGKPYANLHPSVGSKLKIKS